MNKKLLAILLISSITFSKGYIKLSSGVELEKGYIDVNVDKERLLKDVSEEEYKRNKEMYDKELEELKEYLPYNDSKNILNNTGIEFNFEHKGLEINGKLKLDDYYLKWERAKESYFENNDPLYVITKVNLDKKLNLIKNSNLNISYTIPRYKNFDIKVKTGIRGIKNNTYLGNNDAESHIFLGLDGGYNFKNVKIGLDSELSNKLTTKNMWLKENVYLKANTRYLKDIEAKVGMKIFIDNRLDKRYYRKVLSADLSGNYTINNNLKISVKFNGIYGLNTNLFPELDYEPLNIIEDNEIESISWLNRTIYGLETNLDEEGNYYPQFLKITSGIDGNRYYNSITFAKFYADYAKNNFNLKIKPYMYLFGNGTNTSKNKIGKYFGVNIDISKKIFDKWTIGANFDISKFLNVLWDNPKYSYKNRFDIKLYTSYNMKLMDKLIFIPSANFEYMKNDFKMYKNIVVNSDIYVLSSNKIQLEANARLKYFLTDNILIEGLMGVKFKKQNGNIRRADYKDDEIYNISGEVTRKIFKLGGSIKYTW